MEEDLVYLLGPAVPTARDRGRGNASAGTARPILNLTNVIHQTVCAGAAPIPVMWATADWQRGFVTPADPALFAVPDDADCPLAAAGDSAAGDAAAVSSLAWPFRLAHRA